MNAMMIHDAVEMTWRCSGCGMSNGYGSQSCAECGGLRNPASVYSAVRATLENVCGSNYGVIINQPTINMAPEAEPYRRSALMRVFLWICNIILGAGILSIIMFLVFMAGLVYVAWTR